MTRVRVIGAIAAAAGAVALLVLGAPDDVEHTPERATAVDLTTEARAALDIAGANEGIADSAPQQQVVNGWVARDLLDIQVQQLDRISAQLETLSERPVTEPPDDHRVPALLALGVAVGCLGLLTTARTAKSSMADPDGTSARGGRAGLVSPPPPRPSSPPPPPRPGPGWAQGR